MKTVIHNVVMVRSCGGQGCLCMQSLLQLRRRAVTEGCWNRAPVKNSQAVSELNNREDARAYIGS